MGDSVEDMLQHLCRLCARTDKSCVNVFSSVGEKYSIQKKIRLCLPVIVVEQDEMPRQICLSCLNKLESTYEFHTTCISAQSTIQRLLKARSLDDNDNVKPDIEMKESAPVSFSLDQFLKRKIDLADSGTSRKVQRTDDRMEEEPTYDNMRVESAKSPDAEVGTTSGNGDGSAVTTSTSEFQSVVTGGGSSTSPATPAETQKPKLRVKTTSELREPGHTSTVTDCTPALLSLPGPSAQSVSVRTSREVTCVGAPQSTSVVFSQSAVPQSGPTTSSIPQYVKSSLLHHVKSASASNGVTIRPLVAQNAESVSPALQFGNNSCVPQSAGSSPSVLRCSTGSSSALQTATSPLSALQNVTALLPRPKNAVSLPAPKSTAASLNVPPVSLSVLQNVTNSSSLQQYSLSVPTSLSSGRAILPNVSQYIIVPNSFASTSTFTAAGTNTVTVLTQPLPSNLSVVGGLGAPPGSATASVSPQPARPPVPAPVQPLTVSTAAVPLASSSLPLVQAVPLRVTQQLSNPVVMPVTSAPGVISASGTPPAAFSVLRRSSQEFVITADSRAAAGTSTASAISRGDGQHSTRSRIMKVSSSSPVGSAGSKVPKGRLGAKDETAGSRADAAVRGSGGAASTVLSKQNGSVPSGTNAVTLSRAVSQLAILPKPAPPVVDAAKNITSHSSSLLRSHRIYTVSVQDSKQGASAKPTKTSSQGSNCRDSDIPKTVLTYSRESATKANCSPTDKGTKAATPVSLPQGTVIAPATSVNSTSSVPVGPAQQQREGARSVAIQKINNSSAGNRQLPGAGAKAASPRGESQAQPREAAPRPPPSGGVPPPPPTVRLDSASAAEKRRRLAHGGSAGFQKCEATSTSGGHQVDRENSPKQGVKNVEASQKSGVSSGHQVDRENSPKQGVKNVEAPQKSGNSSGHQVDRENSPKQGVKIVEAPQKSGISSGHQVDRENSPKQSVKNVEAPQKSGNSSGHQVDKKNSPKQAVKNVEASQKSGISNRASMSEVPTKLRGPVVTATVKPFSRNVGTTTDGGGPSPEGEEAEDAVEEVEVEPPAAGHSPPAAPQVKEECPYCHVAFPPGLLIHHKSLHYREKFYSCIDCDKNFVTEKGLETHRCLNESRG